MVRALAISMLGVLLAACSSARQHGDAFKVAGDQYAKAFDAAREVLVSRRFELERIDSRAGVITTKPKTSSGLATPWDTEQCGFKQEVEDLLNRQQRIVRVTFEAAGAGDVPPEDLRLLRGELTARVEVVIERLHRPGWQLQPEGVRFSSIAQDPTLPQRGMAPTYAVPFSQDPELAGRLAADIQKRFESQGTREQAAK